MKNYLFIELRNCINRKEFKIMSIIILSISLLSFIAECMVGYGGNLSNVRSAYELGMIQGINSLLPVMILLLPMLSVAIYADTFYSDYVAGIYKLVVTRTTVKTYLWGKVIAIVIVTFMVFFISLTVNQLLSIIAFPMSGYGNHYGYPEYSYAMSFVQGVLFDSIRIRSPLLYNMIFIFNISLFAALFALIGFGVYLYTQKGKFSVISSIYMVFIINEILCNTLGLDKWSISSYLNSGNYGDIKIMMIWICILSIISGSLIIMGINKKSKDIGI